MANIISIATALPKHRHLQEDILGFMQKAYGLDETDKRKLSYLYHHSAIDSRHSVIEDFGQAKVGWSFIPKDELQPYPMLAERMKAFSDYALPLSTDAITDCIQPFIKPSEITHLITVSCTGMTAPGLDLQIAEAMDLPVTVFRTSVNFMGCYAAIHALKLAKLICDSDKNVNVVIVATELCTLHFQKEFTLDNAASSLLFADSCAAVLVSNNLKSDKSLTLKNFYSEIAIKGKNDMSWQLDEKGFLMTLSSYIPQLIQEDIAGLVDRAVASGGLTQSDISHWCIHPGGKKILEVIQKQLHLADEDLSCSREVLQKYGNMSSPTILFVLKELMESIGSKPAKIFGVAFGPGLTMETFIASKE